MSAKPSVGSVIRERTFSSVDLPAPLRPMIPTTSPGSISSETSRSAEDRPAEAVDRTDHRIDSVQRAPRLVEETARVRDRRREEPQLRHERHYVAHVAVLHVQRGQPEADAENRCEREQDEQREEEDL